MDDLDEVGLSNPELPPGMKPPAFDPPIDDGDNRLSNADFRTILMSTRSSGATPAPPPRRTPLPEDPYNAPASRHDDKATARRKRKQFYAKLKRQEEERQAELERKYRDRARERRDGQNVDYEGTEGLGSVANYRSVAPTMSDNNTAAELRRKQIQESKFLGGDMEHTHLVKGLDYALLQKVRSEISSKEKESHELSRMMNRKLKKNDSSQEGAVSEESIEFRTKLARNIFRAVFSSEERSVPQRNELFLPGRMAYVVNLEEDDEVGEEVGDIPTTVIRSKADCPTLESHTTLTTNEIVINKLTQILGSFRSDGKKGKKGKRHKKTVDSGRIFEDTEEVNKPPKRPGKSYFTAPVGVVGAADSEKDRMKDFNEAWTDAVRKQEASRLGTKNIHPDRLAQLGVAPGKPQTSGKKAADSYMECYPSFYETGLHDSDDDDDDFSKMDQGKRKGPIGRWDFETTEEYSSYMGSKEVLPKAAFQFGIKMDSGRKTKRNLPKDEKSKLDRELKQIQKIIDMRSTDGESLSKKRR